MLNPGILLPDTQNYVNGTSSNGMKALQSQITWILSSQVLPNIAFVLHEGDMTGDGSSQTQWDKFASIMKQMDGKVPYALATGNHDKYNDAGYTHFNSTFPLSTYKSYSNFKGSYTADSLKDAYYLFSASGRNWLVLLLEYGPSDAVLTWAGQIADQYPNHHIIVVTHCYMYFGHSPPSNALDNTRLGQKTGGAYQWMCDTNNGQKIWDKFVNLHQNITFVFSGHILGTGAGRRVDSGTNGNQIYQIMADYQELSNGGNGYLRIVDIYPDDQMFKVKTYSPYTGLYKTDDLNQFEYTSVNSFGTSATPTSTPLPGDIWGAAGIPDGHVDMYDFNKMRTSFGNPYTIFDYNILVGNFGK
jgi:hypothetical protein